MKHNRFNTFEKQKIVSQNYPVKLSKIFGVMRKKKSIHEFFLLFQNNISIQFLKWKLMIKLISGYSIFIFIAFI